MLLFAMIAAVAQQLDNGSPLCTVVAGRGWWPEAPCSMLACRSCRWAAAMTGVQRVSLRAAGAQQSGTVCAHGWCWCWRCSLTVGSGVLGSSWVAQALAGGVWGKSSSVCCQLHGQNDPTRGRTWNLRFRRPTPYPFGHRTLPFWISLSSSGREDCRRCHF